LRREYFYNYDIINDKITLKIGKIIEILVVKRFIYNLLNFSDSFKCFIRFTNFQFLTSILFLIKKVCELSKFIKMYKINDIFLL